MASRAAQGRPATRLRPSLFLAMPRIYGKQSKDVELQELLNEMKEKGERQKAGDNQRGTRAGRLPPSLSELGVTPPLRYFRDFISLMISSRTSFSSARIAFMSSRRSRSLSLSPATRQINSNIGMTISTKSHFIEGNYDAKRKTKASQIQPLPRCRHF